MHDSGMLYRTTGWEETTCGIIETGQHHGLSPDDTLQSLQLPLSGPVFFTPLLDEKSEVRGQ